MLAVLGFVKVFQKGDDVATQKLDSQTVQTKHGARVVYSLKGLGKALQTAFTVMRAKHYTEPAIVAREAAAHVEANMLPDRAPGWFVVDGYSVQLITFQTTPVRVLISAHSGVKGRRLKARYVVDGSSFTSPSTPSTTAVVVDDDP